MSRVVGQRRGAARSVPAALRGDLVSAGPSDWVVWTQYAASRVMLRSRALRRKLANVGEVADYVQWGLERFGAFRPVARREALWEAIADRLPVGPIRGFEFGVAWGYASAWWLDRLQTDDLRWDGFDRFLGLPRRWRDLDEGAFDAQGHPPAIVDDRVTWHVGDVEATLGTVDLQRRSDEAWLVIFDLDIYEPSAFAWQALRTQLRAGDLLYFDEAFARDERHLLDHDVLPAGRYELVGATPLAQALRVLQIG